MIRVTDEERREVARRLRELNPNDPAWNGIHGFDFPYFADAFFDAIYQNGYESGNWAERLADLIEPSEPQVKRELKYRARCDELGAEMKRQRDALLKLADEMERMPQCELCPAEIVDCSAHPDGCPDALLDHYARRIREALGVSDG